MCTACAEIHLRLRVGRHGASQVLSRQKACRDIPQGTGRAGLGQVAFVGQHTAQYPFDVAVENRHALTETERGNGAGGGAADARQGLELLRAARKLAAETRHDILGATVQVARPAVITQPGPQRQHVVQRRGGQIGDGGKAVQEAGVVVQHGADLRLLQHDFRAVSYTHLTLPTKA